MFRNLLDHSLDARELMLQLYSVVLLLVWGMDCGCLSQA